MWMQVSGYQSLLHGRAGTKKLLVGSHCGHVETKDI